MEKVTKLTVELHIDRSRFSEICGANKLIMDICKLCPSLKRIDFLHCRFVDNKTITRLVTARRGKEIKTIRLRHFHLITDDAILKIAENCKKLQSLILIPIPKGYSLITDLSILSIAKECPDLQLLNLSHCKLITDKSISLISEKCRNLQVLILDHCPLITDKSISAIAKNCPKLKEINISYCRLITDESISAIAKKCLELQSINICQCDAVTDASVSLIAQKCLELQSINVLSTNITNISIIDIITNCPKLNYLSFVSKDEKMIEIFIEKHNPSLDWN